MRTLIHINLISIAFFSLHGKATESNIVQTERELYEECSAHSQAGMLDCLATKAHESEQALAQAEKHAVATISQWDEDKKYISIALKKLVASHKNFAKYRTAQCELSASLSGGAAGNTQEMGRLACTTELNNRRTENLHQSIADIPLK